MKLLDTGIWLFCFDTLCQVAYMIYITNARINILSITADCKEYRLFVAHSSQESATTQRSQDPRVCWGEAGICAVDPQENH